MVSFFYRLTTILCTCNLNPINLNLTIYLKKKILIDGKLYLLSTALFVKLG